MDKESSYPFRIVEASHWRIRYWVAPRPQKNSARAVRQSPGGPPRRNIRPGPLNGGRSDALKNFVCRPGFPDFVLEAVCRGNDRHLGQKAGSRPRGVLAIRSNSWQGGPMPVRPRGGPSMKGLRPHRHLGSILRIELLHDIAHVHLHRAFTHIELVGDDLIRLAFLYRSHDRVFAASENADRLTASSSASLNPSATGHDRPDVDSRFSVSLTVEGATPRRRAISRVATPAENFRRMISRASRMATLSAGIVCSLGTAKGADFIRPAAALATFRTPGGIIPFRWAASSRNGGRHHSVTTGDIISFRWAASTGISTVGKARRWRALGEDCGRPGNAKA